MPFIGKIEIIRHYFSIDSMQHYDYPSVTERSRNNDKRAHRTDQASRIAPAE